jgi:hypothetical protein
VCGRDLRGSACGTAGGEGNTADAAEERLPVEAAGPPGAVALVRDGVTLIRKVAGALLPRRTCFKLAFAEFLGSGSGAELHADAPEVAPESDPAVSTEEDDSRPEVQASAPEPPADTREVDRWLQELISERQRQGAKLAAYPRFGLLHLGRIPEGIRLVPGRAPELHGAALEEARSFLRALEISVTVEPPPERTAAVRPELDRESRRMRNEVRFKVRGSAETRRPEGDSPILMRDRRRCTAPGCRSVGSGRLHIHHVIERPRGGCNEASYHGESRGGGAAV